MANLNKSRGKNGKEKPALQLTSYQLVMAICALLLLMCVLFIAGILVQRFSDSGQQKQVAVKDSASLEPSRLTEPAPSSTPKTEGVQVAPQPVTLPPEGNPPGSTAAKKTTETDAKYLPAPPPRRDHGRPVPKPETSSTTSKPETTAKETPESTPVSTPATPEKPTQPAVPEAPKTETTPPAKTEPPKTEEKPATPETKEEPETNPTTKAATDSEKGPFTVQVASFDSNNLERAKRFKTDLEKNTKYSVKLVPSSDGKHIRAYVGEYADRGAAEKARDSMRKIEDFKGCFVKALNEE